jgi:hypothetical protein
LIDSEDSEIKQGRACSPPARQVVAAILLVAVVAGGGAAMLLDEEGNSSPGAARNAVGEARQERTPAGRPRAPGGTITAAAAGPVRVGMTEAEVRTRLSAPDRKVAVNFGGGPEPPQRNWIWDLPDGEFVVYFDTAKERVAGFNSTSSLLRTPSGATVGSLFGPVQEASGDRLRLSPIGDGIYILSAGRPGSFPALFYFVLDGEIVQLGAGHSPPAGD